MPRGGRRKGSPGTAYPNRVDLHQPATTAPDQPYGTAGAQRAAQQAIPLPAGGALPAPTSPTPRPGTIDLTAPTARPDEHVLTTPPAPDPLRDVAATLNGIEDLDPESKRIRDILNQTLVNRTF